MVPAILLLEIIGVLDVPEHTVSEDGNAVAIGVGFTNTVAIIGAPGQPSIAGIMLNVASSGSLVVFVNAPLISPEP